MSRIICLESVGSTNDYLKQEAKKNAPEGTIVLANEQTAGRGRMGKSFASPPSMGIYMSMLLRPCEAADSVPDLTANTAVAVCKAIEKVCGIEPEIKWINDIMLRGKKICGILCESVIGEKGVEYVILGIGLNVITRIEDFPNELHGIAGSIYSQTGMLSDRGKLIMAIVNELDTMYAAWKKDKKVYLNEYRSRCKMLGHTVELISRSGTAKVLAEDISDDFGLTVRTENGECGTLHSGDFSIRYPFD